MKVVKEQRTVWGPFPKDKRTVPLDVIRGLLAAVQSPRFSSLPQRSVHFSRSRDRYSSCGKGGREPMPKVCAAPNVIARSSWRSASVIFVGW